MNKKNVSRSKYTTTIFFLVGLILVYIEWILKGYDIKAILGAGGEGWAFLVGGEIPITLFGALIAFFIYRYKKRDIYEFSNFLNICSKTFFVISSLRVFFIIYY